MQVCYHMVKIDGTETLCIGGHIVADDENPGMLWLTSVQGEKILHIHHSDYRVITRADAEAHLKVLHAKKQATGANLEAVCALTGKTVVLASATPAPEPTKKNYGFKPFPAFPEPPPKPWNN